MLAGGAVRALAIAGSLLAAAAEAAEGDLDPAFGDVGRVGPITSLLGNAWSMEAMPDGSLMLAGGHARLVCPRDDPGCYDWGPVGYSATNFLTRVSNAGHIDDGFQSAILTDTQLFAVARQPDGKFVVAGRKLFEDSLNSQLVIYRLNGNGTLDTSFGVQGRVQLRPEDRGEIDDASAVLVQADGRIIVAGSRRRSSDESRILIRFLANGEFDDTFGASGIVVVGGGNSGRRGASRDLTARTHVLRIATGAYRVTTKSDAGCRVIGLTEDGAFDPAFGTSGVVQIDLPRSACSFMLAQADGHLVVAGDDFESSFVVRLRAGGQRDPGFSATAVGDSLGRITGLAVGPNGTIVVAGKAKPSAAQPRAPAATILRLLANGELDASFGDAGQSAIDMPSDVGSDSLLHDMSVRQDGAVLAAGGDEWSDKPILVRLLGAGGGDGPGVLGVTLQGVVFIDEVAGDVVLEVRRTGGAAGHVSVAYQVTGNGQGRAATAGEDFVADAGRLEWDDGDMTPRVIRVRILNDDTPEDFEQVAVPLTDVRGGAGVGTSGAIVEILANDGPVPPPPPPPLSSTIALAWTSAKVGEGGLVTISVVRSGSSAGALSVDYQTASGTAAAGTDFTSASDTLTWADGDATNKTFTINTLNDATDESNETFTVALSNPSTGAALGSNSTLTVTITDDDPSSDDQPGLALASTETTTGEAGGSVVLTVVRSGAAVGTVSVDYATSSGTAIGGSDFSPANGTLRWADGDSSNKSIRVDVTDDGQNEGDETFALTLSNPSEAVLGSNSAATVTITDNDPLSGGDGNGTGGGGSGDRLLLLGLLLIGLTRLRVSGHPGAPSARPTRSSLALVAARQ